MSAPAPTAVDHRVRWFVYVDRDRIPKTRQMRGTWGHDAVCSCGWDSRTGGATLTSVRRAVAIHKVTGA